MLVVVLQSILDELADAFSRTEICERSCLTASSPECSQRQRMGMAPGRPFGVQMHQHSFCASIANRLFDEFGAITEAASAHVGDGVLFPTSFP